VKTETEVADKQAGFRQARWTRDQITNLRILMYKARKHQQPLCVCFVDFKTAFNSISHDKLWVTMMDMRYPLHLIDLLAKLFRKQLAKVKVAGTLSEWFHVKKGVRQGCVLSSYLFNILAKMVKTLDGFQGGLQFGGRITNLRYADDIILLATSGVELQELADRLNRVSRKYSLLINVDKTNVMASDGIACRILIQNEQLEQVDTFPYLGSLITEGGECTTEFRTINRGQASGALPRGITPKIWKSHSIPISTKIRLMKALVWPV